VIAFDIPFNRAYLTGNELENIARAHQVGQLSGDGPFTEKCSQFIERAINSPKTLLTHSCTAALEMTALLIDIKPGDEVILPSYTFVSTVNAFVLRGAIPVFVDIRPDTKNINEIRIEESISNKTKAIIVVHYAGVSCEMAEILRIAKKYDLIVIEDAAQAIFSRYNEAYLGTLGDFGCFSFHETKNITCGEGGAISVNRADLREKAEIVREKGTNRTQFSRGEISKYSWVDVGSSYLPGEISAAFLMAQLESGLNITQRRLAIWKQYQDAFAPLEEAGSLTLPYTPGNCDHNAHIYYLVLADEEQRESFIRAMSDLGIQCVSHYVPLHMSSFFQRLARALNIKACDLPVTEDVYRRLVRLPLWLGVDVERVIDSVYKTIECRC